MGWCKLAHTLCKALSFQCKNGYIRPPPVPIPNPPEFLELASYLGNNAILQFLSRRRQPLDCKISDNGFQNLSHAPAALQLYRCVQWPLGLSECSSAYSSVPDGLFSSHRRRWLRERTLALGGLDGRSLDKNVTPRDEYLSTTYFCTLFSQYPQTTFNNAGKAKTIRWLLRMQSLSQFNRYALQPCTHWKTYNNRGTIYHWASSIGIQYNTERGITSTAL